MTITSDAGGEVARPEADRPADAAAPRRELVVGIDGTAAASAALRWATEQAAVTGAKVVAIAITEPPSVVAGGSGVTGAAIIPEVMSQADLTAMAERWLTGAVAALPGGTGRDVETRVTYGDAATVLLDAARDAELLVLGNHARGALIRVLTGSVSQRCAHRAPCPLVLVPAPPP